MIITGLADTAEQQDHARDAGLEVLDAAWRHPGQGVGQAAMDLIRRLTGEDLLRLSLLAAYIGIAAQAEVMERSADEQIRG